MQGAWLVVLEGTWDQLDLLEVVIFVALGFQVGCAVWLTPTPTGLALDC